MEVYYIEFKLDKPKYVQISQKIKVIIERGIINDGEKLPSIRKLSELLNVNKDTVINAYRKLEEEGYAIQKIGSGTYAKKRDTGSRFKKDYSNTIKNLSYKNQEKYIDLVGEATISSYFPIKNFKTVLNEVLDRDGSKAFIYKEVLGYEGLRKSINNFFWDGKRKSEEILIVSGAQQGIDVISKAIINVRDNIIVEKPTYNGALSVFKWRRANIIEVPIENDGIDLDQFEKILQKNKIKCFYAMSYFQNPTGVSYSMKKKKRILELASIYDFYIIEDDYLSELIYDESITYNSFKSLDINDRVIYIKSFSKIFLPGIRLGYLICPKKFLDSTINCKINTDITTSSLMQRALDLYINRGYWKEHIDMLRNNYKETYNVLTEVLAKELSEEVSFNLPKGGLNLYLKLHNTNSIDFFYKCKEQNIITTPGVFFYKNYKEGLDYVKLGFSNLRTDQILSVTNILKEIFKTK